MIPKDCKRLAEVDFPIATVSKHVAREKSIRHGHPSTLHLWWARRPLAACRAVLFASLADDRQEYIAEVDSAHVDPTRTTEPALGPSGVQRHLYEFDPSFDTAVSDLVQQPEGECMRLRTRDQVTAEIDSCLVATASFLLGIVPHYRRFPLPEKSLRYAG